jgi:glycosyltransferase involved in cell wall biosynthesis
MERIVKNHEAGFVFQASNSTDLVEKILEMQSNNAVVTSRVENAYRAVNDNLNWENESQKLIQLINKYNG